MKGKSTLTFAAVLALFISPSVFGQQANITLKDAKEISYQAKATVQGFEQLLNFVTFTDNVQSDLIDVINNSYKPSRNRIFYDKNIVVEDDVDPAAKSGAAQDIPIDKYLNNLDIQYLKTKDAGVKFSNVLVSDIKKKDYIYIKIKYTSSFASKNKVKNIAYPAREREALLRVENEGGHKWSTYIIGLNYYNPANPIEAVDNNVQVATDSTSNATIVSDEELKKQREEYIRAKEEEEKKNEAIAQEYLTMATTYTTGKQYKEALELLEKAKNLRPLVPSIDKSILDTKKLIAENTYENYKNKGDKAKSDRRFNDAIQFYEQAVGLRPEAHAILAPEISALTTKLGIISLPKNKLLSNDFLGAIDESDKALKDNKKIKNEFPELYFIKGAAFEGLLASKPDDDHNRDKALENYNQAILFFPNYTDARLARANFYVVYKSDYVSAITDYDVLATNALDDSPEKPVYFITKAKWKNIMHNYTGATEDFNKAISLKPTVPLYYFKRGEFNYRIKNYAESLKDFDMTVKLDDKYKLAYYYRGLAYAYTNSNTKAGLDFIETEKLGAEPAQLKTIDSLSNNFFVSGEQLLANHDMANADSAYNNALKLRSKNASALHGKAEIRLITADELFAKKKTVEATDMYRQSIALNKQAIVCNSNFSDAYFKEALAQFKLKEYDFALTNYSEAIRSDNNNTRAYIERGNTYQTTAQYPKSIDDYNQSIALLTVSQAAYKKSNSKDELAKSIKDLSMVSQLLGQSLYNVKDYTNAMLTLDKAIDFSQTNAEAYYYRGLTNEEQGQLSKAIKDYAEALKNGSHYKYYFASGKALYKNKNYPEAANNFDESIKLDTANVIKNKYYMLGLCNLKTKSYDAANTAFKKYDSEETSKADADFHADYGMANLYINNDSVAVKQFNLALLTANTHARALYGSGCALAKAGQYDKALELFDKAFATRQINKDDLKVDEEAFLAELNKVKINRNKYNQLKKTYLNN